MEEGVGLSGRAPLVKGFILGEDEIECRFGVALTRVQHVTFS